MRELPTRDNELTQEIPRGAASLNFYSLLLSCGYSPLLLNRLDTQIDLSETRLFGNVTEVECRNAFPDVVLERLAFEVVQLLSSLLREQHNN